MMLCWLLLLLVLLPHEASAGGSVSVNIKDLGAIDGLQSLDIRGANAVPTQQVVLSWCVVLPAVCNSKFRSIKAEMRK